jgi:pimeloyl-ACP methyl ester carboxylesterase
LRASDPRADGLRTVTTPMLVIHGDADTLIDISGGRRTAELVPGARFEVIEGMGHDYPPQLWDRWVELVAELAGLQPATDGNR